MFAPESPSQGSLGVTPSPSRSIPLAALPKTAFEETGLDGPRTRTPAPLLKAMVLPAPLAEPPMALSLKKLMSTPFNPFPKGLTPFPCVPMKLPCTVLG